MVHTGERYSPMEHYVMSSGKEPFFKYFSPGNLRGHWRGHRGGPRVVGQRSQGQETNIALLTGYCIDHKPNYR